MKYRAEIDGLRALAIVPVILFHAGFELFSGGFVGVDVFFVISGYLITTILIEDIENKRFSIVNFYERRARRILPALFFVMLVCILFAWMWMLPNQMKDFSQSLVAVSLFASNILFWRESGYFTAAAEEKPLLHTWSLAVEEQYYVLFPIFLILAWRFGKNRVFWMVVVMAAISFLLSEWGWRNKATANFYLAPTRAWELLSGSIAAFIVQKKGVQSNNLLALIGLAAVIFSIFAYDESIPFPSVYTLVPVLGVVLLVLYAGKETISAKMLSAKVFVGIDLISYSAYLWHQPLFAFAKIRLLEPPSQQMMLALSIASIVLAYFSWKCIEVPFRNAMKFNRKVILLGSVIGLFLFISIGLTLTQKQFESLRLGGKPLLNELYPPHDAEWAKRVRSASKICDTLGLSVLQEEVCFTNSNQPKLLIVGDSKAMALSSAIFSGYYKMPTLLISAHSCPMYPNLKYTPTYRVEWNNNCTEIANKIIGIKAYIPSLEKVFIVNYAVKSDEERSRYFFNGNSLTNNEAMLSGFSFLIEDLLKNKIEVTFFTDVPKLKYNPLLCIYRYDAHYCDVKESDIRDSRSRYYENISILSERFDFNVFDTLNVFCRDDRCSSYANGKVLYFDKTHLTPFGAAKILEKVFTAKSTGLQLDNKMK